MIPEIITNDSGWPYTKAKTAVLTAAAAVISEEGPRAATLKNIATRAGITEPAIFRHFDGVDGLFAGLYSAFERMYCSFGEAFAAKDQRGLARLRGALFAFADTLVASAEYSYLLIHAEQVFRGYPELRGHVAELRKRDERRAVDCVVEGMKSGEIRSDVDPSTTAATLTGVLLTEAMAWIESGYGFDLSASFRARWEELERLVSSKPAAKPSGKPVRIRTAAFRVENPSAKASAKAVHKDAPAAKPASKPRAPAAKKKQ